MSDTLTAPTAPTGTITLLADQCKRMVAVWEAAACKDEPFGALSGLHLTSDGKALRAFATDGKLLLEEILTPDEFTFPVFAVTLTAIGVSNLRAMLKTAPKGRAPAEVAFSLREKDCLVSGWGSTVVVPHHAGTYPDVSQAFRSNSEAGACTVRHVPYEDNGTGGVEAHVEACDFALDLKYLVALAKCWGGKPIRFRACRGMILTPLDGEGRQRALLMPINLPA